jgi:hypothetical protein
VSEIFTEGGDIIFPDSRIPPPADPKIHAQIYRSGGSGDGGDIFLVCMVRIVIRNRLTWLGINLVSPAFILHPQVSMT